MKYRKGSRVEVLDKRELPSATWRCGEIISGNGHTYSVRYDGCSPETGVDVERVSRKAIRPCPPIIRGPKCWVPGDVVEICEDASWKLAQVSRAVGVGYYFVRLLGSTRDFRAHESDLRVRQVWQDDRWIVTQKRPGKCDDDFDDNKPKTRKSILGLSDEKKDVEGNRLTNIIDADVEKQWPQPSRSMKKRPQHYFPLADPYCRERKRVREVEKEGGHRQLVAEHPTRLLNKVDAVASPCTLLGEKYMHTSLNNKSTRFCDMRELNTEAESMCSSVGSCSAISSPHRSLFYPIVSPSQNSDSHIDESESPCGVERESFLSAEERLAEEIHHIELHAYHSTMLAFHSSGPLTWEKEALLTNLRLMLHISNDEHLLEIRNLVSATNSHPSS